MIEAGIVTRIEALIPSLAGSVFPIDRQDVDGMPALIYERVSTARSPDISGLSPLVLSRFQFTVYAGTYDEMISLRKEIPAAFLGFVGDLGNGARCYGATAENDSENFETELELFAGSVDVSIWHTED